MSIDYENMTCETLSNCKRSEKFDYASYWQALFEAGIPLERFYSHGDGKWVKVTDDVLYDTVYRKIPQPTTKMVPLDFTDYLDIKDKWIIDTRTNEKCFISFYFDDSELNIQYCTDNHNITFADLQKYFTLDGKRLEKEVAV